MSKTRRVVPAGLLRMRFDNAGLLVDWHFVDPANGASIPIQDTQAQAERWFDLLVSSPGPVPPRIRVRQQLIPGSTTLNEAIAVFGSWHPDFHCDSEGPVPLYRKVQNDFGTVLEWYVDRPSHLFIPPMYLVATFDRSGGLLACHLQQTYPGGLK